MKNLIFSVLLIIGFSGMAGASVSSEGQAINQSESMELAGLMDWLFGSDDNDREQQNREQLFNQCFDDCFHDPCNPGRGGDQCREFCRRQHMTGIESLKIASIKDQNPFHFLKEKSQDKPPLMLVDDYSECMDDCICRGGSPGGCSQVCD